LRPPTFVPETRPAVDLLQDMRRRHTPFVVVVDEQGGVSGIVTMEDLVEELVGDIFSEHAGNIPAMFTEEADGSVLVDGAAPLRELNRALDIELPEGDDFGTVAGLAMSMMGRMPATGERFVTPNGVTVEIVEATARRVSRVRLRRGATRA